MVNSRKVLAAALFLGVSAVSPTKPLLAQRHAKIHGKPEEEDENPADSDTIEGPDCGHVRKIIGQWGHAKKVGQYAGLARAAVSAADKAATNTDNSVDRAEKVGKEISEDGEVPSSISGAADFAADASKEATKLATELDTKLIGFKDSASNSEFSGEDVSSTDMQELKELTQDTNAAAVAANKAGALVIEKAEAAKKDALKNSGKALKLIKAVVEEGEPLVKEGKEIEQKVGWAKDKADTKVEEATALVVKIKKKAAKSDEQAPVFEALAADVEAKAASVKDGKDSLNLAITDLETAISALDDAVAPLKAAAEKGDGGDTTAVLNEAESVAPGETAVGDADAAISKVKGRAKTMMDRMERLDDAVAKAEKKLK